MAISDQIHLSEAQTKQYWLTVSLSEIFHLHLTQLSLISCSKTSMNNLPELCQSQN